jgi:hypothetical protein
VISKGLTPDQAVVIDGQYRLVNGSKIKIVAPQAS